MTYWSHQLWKIDLSLSWYYALGRSYKTSLGHRPPLPKGTGNFLTYGETPFSTFQTMFSWISPQENMTFAELGCGTGRLSLLASKLWRLQVTGVDLIAPFIHNASTIAEKHCLSCTFIYADIRDIDWSEFDILYITSTTYSEELLSQIWSKCSSLKSGALLMSLTHAPPKEHMKILKMEVLDFSWGVATVYLSRRR